MAYNRYWSIKSGPKAMFSHLANKWRHSRFQRNLYIGLFVSTIIWVYIVVFAWNHQELTPARPTSRSEELRILQELASRVRLTYGVISNSEQSHTARISLTNPLLDQPLGAGIRWRLYFSLMRPLSTKSSESGGFRISRVNGYLHRLEQLPLDGIGGLAPGRRYDVDYTGRAVMLSRYDAFPNWYAVLVDPANADVELHAEVLAATVGESLNFVPPLTRPEQFKPPGGVHDPWSPIKRAQVQDGYLGGEHPSESLVRLVPRPVVTQPLQARAAAVDTACLLAGLSVVHPTSDCLGSVAASGATELLRESAAAEVAAHGCRGGGGRTRWVATLCIVDGRNGSGDAIAFANLTRGLTSDQVSEAYELVVDPESHRFSLTAAGPAGLFWAAQSLISLLQPQPSNMTVRRVFDYPRVPYRGLMLDVARNFLPVWEVLRIVDAMSAWKLNRLHLHLSDDEGFRLPITAAFPAASLRCHRLADDSASGECAQPPQLGSHPTRRLAGSGCGHYSAGDYVTILRWAAKRFVRVVPELDTPGHSLAAILAMKTLNISLTDPEDPNRPVSAQAYRNNTINPCIPATEKFVADLLDGVRRLHLEAGQPLLEYHFGGDEAPIGSWTESPACRRMLGLRPDQPVDADAVGRANLRRLLAAAADANVSALFGWADGFAGADGRPFRLADLAPPHGGGTRRTPRVVAMPWHRKPDPAAMALAGYSLVLTPGDRLYLDHRQEPDPEERGLYWAAPFTDLHAVFAYDAAAASNGLGSSVIGLSGALWGETAHRPEQTFGLLAPRLLALADRAWSRADWEGAGDGTSEAADAVAKRLRSSQRDWAEFVSSVGHRELARLARLGIRFRVGPPGARPLVGTGGGGFRLTHELPGMRLFYSLDSPPHYRWVESDQLTEWPAGLDRVYLMAAYSLPKLNQTGKFFAQSRIVHVDR